MERLFLWGTGYEASMVMKNCKSLDCYDILGFIDNDPQKEGEYFFEKKIYSPYILKKNTADKIVVLIDRYEEVCQQIIREYPKYVDKIENKNYFYKETLLKRYVDNKDPEIVDVIGYIKRHGLNVYNYQFREKYLNFEVKVLWDDSEGLYYVYHFGKKMYFSREYDTEEKVIEYYRAVLAEQDEKSPHRYLDQSFNVLEGDVVIDAGVAEGNFALEVINRVKHIFLIESDDEWIRALKVTFRPYKDKVTIINKYLTSYAEGRMGTLDSLVQEPVNFIKMDIEGAEFDALQGARRLISRSDNIKLAICCYHSDFDEILIEKFMDENGIEHNVTDGYIWFPYLFRQTWVSTKLNRAIIRGYRGIYE